MKLKQVKVFLLLLLFSPFACFAQQGTDFEFLVKKIKSDYPGYTEKTKAVNFDQFAWRTMRESKSDTFKAMSKIVDFFHDRHLDLLKSKEPVDTNACKKNLASVLQYFKAVKKLKKFEGFWVSDVGNCIIALKQTGNQPLHYKGYVIESRDSAKIYPGTVFYDFEWLKDNDFFTLAMSSSGLTFYVHSKFRNDSTMTAGPYHKWKRIRTVVFPCLQAFAQMPQAVTGQWLDSNNYLVTVPSATQLNGKIVDSLIKANPSITNRLQNLIVDIRGNTGGRVAAYSPLLPLLYTQPILKVNSEVFCSNDYINKNKTEFAEYIATGHIDSAELKTWSDWIVRMERNIGRFIDSPQDTLSFDTVYTFPKKVAIVVNYGVQSAAEIFILDAMQSKKVTVFGEHTGGAIDYLNFYPQLSPSGKYNLYIATTRRKIAKGNKKLDGVGIAPDIPISDRENDWIDVVKRYYEKH